MKFIKIAMFTFALIASTATLAQSREELCHNAAESDIATTNLPIARTTTAAASELVISNHAVQQNLAWCKLCHRILTACRNTFSQKECYEEDFWFVTRASF